MIENKVKLVIWDLDETFWKGTLEEGGITPLKSNIDLVRTLSARGIINSICSKNDYQRTRAKLTELGVWEHFVLPSISFSPKGQAIAAIIEATALRPENILFLDDNPTNRREVKFFNPRIMTADPVDVLHLLLDHPHLAGKPDPELNRLRQYQFLQRKVEERSSSSLSNEEFLRASNIRVTVDYDVTAHFDRAVELVNRANQLNYTKRRLETPEAVDDFRKELNSFGYHAGCVRAVDNYGDYGLIGFYLLRRRSGIKRLVHFVFSCRTMNMGIEQYIYEVLDKPEIEIVPPVSYGLESHERIDWINAQSEGTCGDTKAEDRPLLLLGGCDLLQLATYCSSNRSEFVNRNEGKFRIRYDDPGFVLSNRDNIRRCEPIRQIPYWKYDDAVRFDAALASSELVIVSMWSSMNGGYYEVGDGVCVRFNPPDARRIREIDPHWFGANFHEICLDDEERLELILRSFDKIADQAKDSQIFVMGCSTLGASENRDNKVRRRVAYNGACKNYCDRQPNRLCYLDVDAVVPPHAIIGNGHFSPTGYFALARYILSFRGGLMDRPSALDGGVIADTDKPELPLVGHQICA